MYGGGHGVVLIFFGREWEGKKVWGRSSKCSLYVKIYIFFTGFKKA
jgi:hypothetical protein